MKSDNSGKNIRAECGPVQWCQLNDKLSKVIQFNSHTTHNTFTYMWFVTSNAGPFAIPVKSHRQNIGSNSWATLTWHPPQWMEFMYNTIVDTTTWRISPNTKYYYTLIHICVPLIFLFQIHWLKIIANIGSRWPYRMEEPLELTNTQNYLKRIKKNSTHTHSTITGLFRKFAVRVLVHIRLLNC